MRWCILSCCPFEDVQCLPFPRDDSNECVPCESYAAIGWMALRRKPADLREQLKDDGFFNNTHMPGLAKWERACVEANGGRVSKSTCNSLRLPEKQVDLVDESRLMAEKNLGVFWPLEQYENTFKRKADAQDIVDWDEDDDGHPEPGVALGSEHGNPTGTTKLTKQTTRGVSKRRRLGDSTGELRKGQLEDVCHAEKRGIMNLEFSEKAGGPEGGPLVLKGGCASGGANKRKRVDDDGSDASSGLPWLPLGMVKKKAKKARGTGPAWVRSFPRHSLFSFPPPPAPCLRLLAPPSAWATRSIHIHNPWPSPP